MLRRTADDTDPFERIFVANADQLLIVVAVADPPPRTGLVERALIAAYAGGLTPILALTKPIWQILIHSRRNSQTSTYGSSGRDAMNHSHPSSRC